jgi:hypothetical protein
MQTPHRFRTKRQLWAYCGLALKTSTSGEYQFVKGQLKRSKKLLAIRGLNANHNHDLKNIFKGAAIRAAAIPGPFQDFYTALLAKGMKPSMARLTLARAEIWPARRSGLSASAELLRVHADARCTRTAVRPHQALGYVTPIEFVERVKKSTQKIHKCP